MTSAGTPGSAAAVVRDSQRAVADSLRTRHELSSMAIDRSWARYESGYVGFARVQMPAGDVVDLTRQYSTTYEVLGATVTDYFPGIAWRYPDVRAGAVIAALGAGDLADFGLAKRYIVLSVQDIPTPSAEQLAKIAPAQFRSKVELGGSLRLKVKTGHTPPLEYNKPIPRVPYRGRYRGPYRGPSNKHRRWRGPSDGPMRRVPTYGDDPRDRTDPTDLPCCGGDWPHRAPY